MPDALVNGVRLNYEIFGVSGPWVTLNPGSRRAMDELIPLARTLAERGFRVLLHDRRNCGASQVGFDGEGSEADIWADDLVALLRQRDALPAYVGGSSSGARLGITLAIRHPKAVKGLLLWRLTGGREAAHELVEYYYDQYARLARAGGMAAVCESEHFAGLIEARPENRARLMQLDPAKFSAVMRRWSADMLSSADMPVIGATEEEIRALRIPVCLIPGNDRVHRPKYTYDLRKMIQGSELHELVRQYPEDRLLETFDMQEWNSHMLEMAGLFSDTINRAERAA